MSHSEFERSTESNDILEAKKELLRLKLDLETKKLNFSGCQKNNELDFIKRVVGVSEVLSIYQVYGYLRSSIEQDTDLNFHDLLFYKVCNQVLKELEASNLSNAQPGDSYFKDTRSIGYSLANPDQIS